MADKLIPVSMPGKELQEEAETILSQAKSYVISSQEMYEAAAEDLRAVAGKRKALLERRLSITRPLDEAKAAVMDLFKKATDFLDQAETVLKKGIRAWDDEQEKIRLDREAAAAEALRKEREALQRKAEKASDRGDVEKAQALIAQAEIMPQSVSMSAPPKADGISYRTNKSAEVKDLLALVKAVAAGQVPLAAVEANMTFLGKQARALGEELNYPGVVVKTEKVVVART